MKNLFFILLITLLSYPAFAQSWNDVEVGQILVFDQSINLQSSAKSNAKEFTNLVIKKDDKLKIIKIQSLDYINVVVLVGELMTCPSPQMTSVMEIVKVSNRLPSTDVGVMLEEKCQFSIYIERKELLNPTFFAN